MSQVGKFQGSDDGLIGKVSNISFAGVGKINGADLITATAVRRLYFDSSNYVPIEPVYSSVWSTNYDDSGSWGFRCHLTPDKIGNAIYAHGFSSIADGTYYCLCRQYISYSLAAQTVPAGNIKGQVTGYEDDLSANAGLYLVIKLCDAFGTVKSTIISGAGSNTEFLTSARNRKFKTGNTTTPIPYSSFEVAEDDRLIIEVGYRVLSKVGHTNSHSYVGLGNSGVTMSDLPEDETTTSWLAPWIEFSQDIFFAPAKTFSYAWSTTTSQNTGNLYLGSVGSRSDALIWGAAEGSKKWNGSVWSTTASAITVRKSQMSFGVASAAIGAGGCTGTSTVINITEQWNGSVWATTSQLPEVRYRGSACGNTTAGLLAAGGGTGISQLYSTRVWQSTAWATTTGNSVTGTAFTKGMVGSTTAAFMFTGKSTTESWDGSAWSTTSQRITDREHGGFSGSYPSALYFGGMMWTKACEFMDSWNGSAWSTDCPQMVSSGGYDWYGFGDTTSVLAANGSWGLPSDLICQVYE